MSTMRPLAVSVDNPRYFTACSGDRRAVYLTGSHIWNNFHDGMGPAGAPPKNLDFGAYLDFLAARGHNFIRLWRWEQHLSPAPDNVEGHPFLSRGSPEAGGHPRRSSRGGGRLGELKARS